MYIFCILYILHTDIFCLALRNNPSRLAVCTYLAVGVTFYSLTQKYYSWRVHRIIRVKHSFKVSVEELWLLLVNRRIQYEPK